MTRWHLRDSQAGTLFFAQFLGSMCGAFLKGRSLPRMIALGFALVALCAGMLAVAPPIVAPLVLFLSGCGLGMAMTSTSVRIEQIASGASGNALASLNAVWAAGAGLAPWLLLTGIHRSLTTFLLAMMIPAALAAGSVLWVVQQAAVPHMIDGVTSRLPPAALPLPYALLLILLSFGAVGVETGLGGWMTAYIARAGLAAVVSTMAASCFWFGLLLSRALLALLMTRRTSAISVLLGAIAFTFGAACLLLVSTAPVPIIFVALLCGCGVGPLYPLVLARALALMRGRAVFAVAGLGAAFVPLTTGLISQGVGSLEVGLLLPLSLLLLMFFALFLGRLGIRETAEVQR
ncbi:sugar MFS transporter [Acidipila sp. EB88]|uniref:MFS transporter n=1 Tax=Acidipila sp. EB88 TaxID=2305226 RepID=UPI000F5E7271|nr:hypothetical protein [Acidipila sp. EB88]